ncbi:unnamed protein product [Mytilus coruscus]|uniref:STAS domain-containing protein n=1 Tax=Mytilus coruscus TaxID=42192 RepID=A0A6J8ALC7_MYTCO|nr:unnamed protein product [Mytilus coruscus]
MIINGGEMLSDNLQLSRSLKTQSELYEFYGKPKRSSRSFSENIKEKCTLSKLCAFLLSLFPVINVIRTYKVRKYILDDIISGLSVACLHFPQGLAFGILASLSPAYGLYTSFFPVLLYVIFGTSQHVSFGTNAVIAIFTAELVESHLEQFDLHGHYPAVNGSTVNNITTVSPRMDNAVLEYKVSVAAVVIATIISYFAKLHDTFGVGVVGEIPAGLPTPQLPRVSVDIIGHSIVVGLIVFVLTISMARLCEVKHGYSVNDNQELVAYGIANLGGSFFSCFPACVAPPRTVILSTMGAKTTLNGIVSAIFVLLVIMFIGKYLESAPKAVLAVMIIVAVKNLLYQFKELPKLWRVNRYDFVIFVGTVLCGVLIDFPYALYVGVLLCLLTVVVQSQNSSSYTIRKVEQEDRLLEQKTHDVPLCNSKIAIFRMESSLYFATADQFIKEVYKATFNPKAYRKLQDKNLDTNVEINTNQSENSVNNDERMSLSKTNHENEIPVVPLTHIIIDCSSMNYIDMNGMKALIQINSEYKQVGVIVMLGNCTNFMKTLMEKSDLSEAIDMKNVYSDILDAYFAATHKK